MRAGRSCAQGRGGDPMNLIAELNFLPVWIDNLDSPSVLTSVRDGEHRRVLLMRTGLTPDLLTEVADWLMARAVDELVEGVSR